MKRLVMTGTVVLTAVSLVECGGETAGLDASTELAGVYEMESKDGEPRPWESFGIGEIDGVPVQVFTTLLAATLTLELDRSFSAEELVRTEIFTLGGQKIFDETGASPRGVGTWSYSRPSSCPRGCFTSVTFRYTTGSSETGTISGGLLTVFRNGSAWVFRRRILG